MLFETLVDVFAARGMQVPQEKEQEFRKRLEKLFQAGGMMTVNKVSMFGIETYTLRKVRMYKNGMNFCYSYFEEDFWEDAGYSVKDRRVRSKNIGFHLFNRTMIAAYVLENLYRDGPGAVFASGMLVDETMYTGWINYLFDEEFCVKNRNPWKLFEALHSAMEDGDYSFSDVDWMRYASKSMEDLDGFSKVFAVEQGIDYMLNWHIKLLKNADFSLENTMKNYNYFGVVQTIVRQIRIYHKCSSLPKKVQFKTLCNHLKALYQEPDLEYDDFVRIYRLSEQEAGLFLVLFLMDQAVIVIEVIAEVYEKKFWDLWEEFRDVVYGTRRVFPEDMKQPPAKSISTKRFLQQSADDLIYFWQEDGDIYFSYELVEWFSTLRKRYDEIMSKPFSVDNPIKWMLELMNYADEEYFHIFAFTDFFEECVVHLPEKKYLALWKLYEEMLHDPKLEEAGSVLFVPDEPGYEDEGLRWLSGNQERRRLWTSWYLTEWEKRQNIARVTLRRYMALVANVELRKDVFGF